MKKSDHSYKNAYVRPDNTMKLPVHQPAISKMSLIETKIDKVPKENHGLYARKDNNQFYSLKENDPILTNQLSVEPLHENLKPRREFKLYTEADLDEGNFKSREKIERLEMQLKRKINECGFMGFFKTLNSSKFSHIDIYLQLTQLEDLLNEKQRVIRERQQELLDKQDKINELEMKHQQNEQKFVAHTEQIRSFTEVIDKMQSKLDIKQNCNDEKYHQLKILFDDLQKQRITLHKRVKDLEDEAQITKSEYAKKLSEMEQRHRSEMKDLSECVNKLKSDCQELAETNSDLRNRCESLCSESQVLSSNIKDLQQQLETQQTKSVETQLEIEGYKENIKELQEQNEQLKSRTNEIQQLKNKLQTETQKKTEYKTLVNQHISKEKKHQEKMSLIKQQLKKAQASLSYTEENVNKLKAQLVAQKSVEKQLKQNMVKYQYETKILIQDKKKLQDLISRLESDLKKHAKTVQTYQTEHDYNSLRLQSVNEKKQSNERFKTIGRLKEVCARLRLYLPEGHEFPPTKESDELERIVSQMAHVVNCLICQSIIPMKKQLQNMTVTVRTLDLQKEYFEESRIIQVQAKEEAIRVLVKFIPEESIKLIEEYLLLLEDTSDCRSETINRKVSLLEIILKEAEKYKVKRLQPEQSTKRFTVQSHRKNMESVRRDKPVSRDIVKKYFE